MISPTLCEKASVIGTPSANAQLLTFIFVRSKTSRNRSFGAVPPWRSTICQGSGTCDPG
jgi:hypothetical protein